MEEVKQANKKLPNGSVPSQPAKQKCRAPSPPKLNSQIQINNSDKEKKLAPLPPKTIEISSDGKLAGDHPDEDGRLPDDEHSMLNDKSHVSIVTIKDDKDLPIIKSSSSTPKIKSENKTIFQVENEQNMSFLSNSRANQNYMITGKHSDHSDYNHRQQQSISPKPPPSSGSQQQQQFLISSRQSVIVSEQHEKEPNHHRRSRPSSYIEMTQHQDTGRELSRESSGREARHESSSREARHESSSRDMNRESRGRDMSRESGSREANRESSSKARHSKVDKLQQINDKLNETNLNSPKSKRTATSSTKCTKTDQASSLELAQRNVKREPSNAGSLSSVDSNQQSITRNSKIIEKGMAMVQLRKNKVGDKVSSVHTSRVPLTYSH